MREKYDLNINEDEIISLIQLGDEKAFRLFYDTYRPRVYQTALRYLKSKELAKEVVQDVFLKIWADREQLYEVKSVKAWVYILAKNNILNRLKRLALEWKANVYFAKNKEDEDLSMLDNIRDKEYHQLLSDAIQSLPKQQREVFVLARYEYLSYQQIGEKLDISPLTVKTHMSRAIGQIRLKMKRLGVEVPLIFFFLDYFF